MERYASYKDSGIEWIGEIPGHWRSTRISSLYDSRNEKASDRDYQPLSVTMRGIVPQLETAAKTQDGDNRKLVRRGDFVINSRSDRRGSCGISPMDGSVSLISNVLAPKSDLMVSEYFEYLFHTEAFADEFYKWGTGIVDDLWSTNWARMKNILVCLPARHEQEIIANYLDAKTAEIDSLIEKTEKSIELLEEYRKSVISEAVTKGLNPDAPMKDSGIDWIGEIPAHWEIKKMKRICESRNGLDYSAENICASSAPKAKLVLRSANIQDGKLLLDDCVYVDKDVPIYLELSKGDLIVVRTNGSKELVGKSAVVEIDESCTAGAFMLIVKSNYSSFIHWLMESSLLRYYTGLFSTSTVNQMSNKHFGEMVIPMPPEIEINQICEFLDTVNAEARRTINMKKALIACSKQYRKSLISEAVTGKFKVPGVE